MKRTVISVAALLMLLPLAASAQAHRAPVFEVVQGKSPWLTCNNRAGLYLLPTRSVAEAHIDAVKSDGGFVDIDGSSDAFEGSVCAQAYSHTSEKMSFYGDMGYNYSYGRQIGGPILMDPSFNAIGFLEYPNDNPGTRTREMYTLDGGMSYRMNERFSIGLGSRYQAGNDAKHKDPRNLNRWMDLELSLGVMERLSDLLSLGFDLKYRRTLESITARTYGVTGNNYFYFIDYGASLGKVEVLGSDNYFISASSERSMMNNIYGAAMQIEAGGSGKRFSIFNELSYERRNGWYGDRATSEIMFTENHGNRYAYMADITLRNTIEQHVRIGIAHEDMTNSLNSFSVISNPGENLEVEYYGQIPIRNSAKTDVTADYELQSGGNCFHPSWRFQSAISYSRDDMTAIYYPYTRRQSADLYSASARGTHSIFKDKNIFDLGMEASFRVGGGDKAVDDVSVEVYGPAPRTAQEYLDAFWEYRTAAVATGCLSFRYTRCMSRRISAYAGVKEKFGSLLQKPEFLDGRFRNTATITVGCIF